MDRKQVKLLVLILVLAGVLGGAAVLYPRLSAEVADAGPALQENQNRQPAVEEDAADAAADTKPTVEEDGTRAEATAEPKKVPAPDFVVYDGQGAEVKLSDLQGKPVIVNFWASWCSSCKGGMPGFEDAYLEYGDEIAFMMVNLTDGGRETLETATEFVAGAGYTFPVYYDTTYSAAIAYGVSSIPATYFIDAEGNAVAWAAGKLDRETLQIGIDLLLPR